MNYIRLFDTGETDIIIQTNAPVSLVEIIIKSLKKLDNYDNSMLYNEINKLNYDVKELDLFNIEF